MCSCELTSIPSQGTFEDDFPFPKGGHMLVPWKLVSLLYNIQATTSDQHRELLPNSKFAGDSQDPQCG